MDLKEARLAETHLHPDKVRRKLRDRDVLSNKWLLHVFAFRIIFHCNTTTKHNFSSVEWHNLRSVVFCSLQHNI
jgi:hypothetical protein